MHPETSFQMSSQLLLIIYRISRRASGSTSAVPYTNAYGIHRFITYQRFLLFRGLPLSSHSSLPSFCSSSPSRSVGRSVGQSFCFAHSPSASSSCSSSSGESRERREGLKTNGLVSRTRLFPEKRANQRRADDLTWKPGELRLNDTRTGRTIRRAVQVTGENTGHM